MQDPHQNTPLHLSAKLAESDPNQLKIINLLFSYGAKPKFKDKNGWKVLDEAVAQQNTNLLALVFDWMAIYKKKKWNMSKSKVITRLRRIPDFYC